MAWKRGEPFAGCQCFCAKFFVARGRAVRFGLDMRKRDEKKLLSHAMSILGSRRSERKTLACRANARRPRKKKLEVVPVDSPAVVGNPEAPVSIAVVDPLRQLQALTGHP